jgi:hypothetical protein
MMAESIDQDAECAHVEANDHTKEQISATSEEKS